MECFSEWDFVFVGLRCAIILRMFETPGNRASLSRLLNHGLARRTDPAPQPSCIKPPYLGAYSRRPSPVEAPSGVGSAASDPSLVLSQRK